MWMARKRKAPLVHRALGTHAPHRFPCPDVSLGAGPLRRPSQRALISQEEAKVGNKDYFGNSSGPPELAVSRE